MRYTVAGIQKTGGLFFKIPFFEEKGGKIGKRGMENNDHPLTGNYG